jgi:aryl-alcohol dehydrogenase-like predicted oxidoreductase
MGDGANEVGASRQHILAGCEASLRRLQTDYIDLYQVHCWDPYVPLEETLSTLNDLVRTGKVRFVGVSNYTAWQLMRALWLSDLHGWESYVCLQPRYNLVDRHIERELLPVCKEFGLGVIPWAPLGGGFLTGKYRRDRDMPTDGRITHALPHWSESMQRQGTEQAWNVLGLVEEIAKARGVTISQVAIAWLLAQEGITAPILGARTIDQLKENLAGAGWQLSAEELQRLDQASMLPEVYPYQFIRDFGNDR